MATQARLEGVTLHQRFRDVRALSRAIAAPLSDADATLQPSPEASPAKWHLAHTTWFLETFVLRDHVRDYRPHDERWAYLFNSYYEGEGARHARDRRGMLSRPSLAELLAYRSRVDDAVLAALPRLDPKALALVELGLHHEQQHQELMLTDMLAAFAENPLAPAIWQPEHRHGPIAAPMSGARFPGGIAEIGQDGRGFAFDCEGPRHRVLLQPYELAARPVTNGEWIQFIDAGGYTQPALWTSDGWGWVAANAIAAPLYWQKDGDGAWLRYRLDGRHPVDSAEPVVHISWYEADAFARWAEARLPTEAEWEVAAAGLDPSAGNQLDEAGPVRPRAAAAGAGQVFGDVWEWTSSPFTPYPGFRPEQGTIGEYNGKFMVNQFVLRGGSCATPRGHLRASYRNFFYPHQRWQFCGLRLGEERVMDALSRAAADPAFRRDVLAGLAAPVRAIPARWLYDRRGSELFEAITRLPEYYLTRADAALLERHSPDVARIAGTGKAVVEFGSGSSAKTPLLLQAVAPAAYVPIDISGEFLRHSVEALQALFPDLPIHAVEADFMRPIHLPAAVAESAKIGFFPGSTIGNMVPGTGVDLLRAMRETLGVGSWLLIGMDRIKPAEILLSAYDDAAGVTAEFNLNLLQRINRELSGTIPVDAFRHRAVWNDALARIEMHLEAQTDVRFTVDDRDFAMAAGETIHTENSHKYGPREARLLLTAGGWTTAEEWEAPDGTFALILARADPPRSAP